MKAVSFMIRITSRVLRRPSVPVLLLGALALTACSGQAASSTDRSAATAAPIAASAPASSAPSSAGLPASAAAETAQGSSTARATSTSGAGACSWNARYPHTYTVDELNRQDGGVLAEVTPGHWTCNGGSRFVADATARPMTVTSAVAIEASAPLTDNSHGSAMTLDQLIAAVKRHPHTPFEITTDSQGRAVRLSSIYQQ